MDNVFTNFIYEEARNDIVYNTIITLVNNGLPIWNYRNGKMRIGFDEVEYSGQLGDLLQEIANIPQAVAKEINEILSTAAPYSLAIVVTNPTVRIFCTDRFGNSIYKWIDESTMQFINRIKNTPFME